MWISTSDFSLKLKILQFLIMSDGAQSGGTWSDRTHEKKVADPEGIIRIFNFRNFFSGLRPRTLPIRGLQSRTIFKKKMKIVLDWGHLMGRVHGPNPEKKLRKLKIRIVPSGSATFVVGSARPRPSRLSAIRHDQKLKNFQLQREI